MTIKLNSNIEKEHILNTLKIFGLNKIKDVVLKSEKERREYGFRFCKNGEIKTTHICKGKECYLDLEHCIDGEHKTVGTFHTHPIVTKGKISFLSDADIYSEATDKSEFACIGAIENNVPKIKCYLPNYGMEKSIVELRNNYKEKYDIKVREYNPGGTSRDILKLPPEKRKELSHLYHTFLLTDKRLKVESSRASLRLIKEPNQGADLVINL
jgi:hypothetical protein